MNCLLLAAMGLAVPHRAPVLAPRAPVVRMAGTEGWTTVVENARGRAAAVKADQDATVAAMAIGTLTVFNLPLVDNVFADLILSSIIGGGLFGITTGFVEGPVGDASRKAFGTVATAAGQASAKVDESGVLDGIKEKLPGGGGAGLTYADIKKYGVSGTIAYILTELAFWAVAFPVASASFFNLNGHWPDFGDGGDRTAVLAFIFAGANVARLVVPLRFGVAFALAPWVDENIVQKFGIGGDAKAE